MLSLHMEHNENFGSVHQAACFKSEFVQRISVTSGVRCQLAMVQLIRYDIYFTVTSNRNLFRSSETTCRIYEVVEAEHETWIPLRSDCVQQNNFL